MWAARISLFKFFPLTKKLESGRVGLTTIYVQKKQDEINEYIPTILEV